MVKNNYAFIPIRSGSKGIYMKNFQNFCGKPLYAWTLEICRMANIFDKIIINVDNEQSKIIVEKYLSILYKEDPHYWDLKIFEIYIRSPHAATDKASTESVILDYLGNNSLKGVFWLLQVTNPFISISNIIEANKLFINHNYIGSIITVIKNEKFFMNKNYQLTYDPVNRPRRQEYNEWVYQENGAFYVSTIESILKTKCRITPPYIPFVMESFSEHEIDSSLDWKICELIFKNKRDWRLL